MGSSAKPRLVLHQRYSGPATTEVADAAASERGDHHQRESVDDVLVDNRVRGVASPRVSVEAADVAG